MTEDIAKKLLTKLKDSLNNLKGMEEWAGLNITKSLEDLLKGISLK
jgi:hypothetical protein